jgi:hypothetical protein
LIDLLRRLADFQNPFEWLQSLAGFATIRQHPLPPRFANRTFPHRLDREKALNTCFEHFDSLLASYEDRDSKSIVVPASSRFPIIATIAAPGGGKSYFLDEVGAVREEDVDKFCKSKWAQSLKSSLVIKISFNGFSNLAGVEDCDSLALCTRILYRY